MGLEGQTAIVTGGALGLGRAFAEGLAAGGASVAICDVLPEVTEVASDLSAQTGAAVEGIVADVTKLEDVRHVVDMTVEQFGRVDILVNNAGVMRFSAPTDPLEKSLDDFTYMVDANLKGTFLCGRAVAPLMVEQRGGNIVNVATDHLHTCGWPEPVTHDDAPTCPRGDRPRPGSYGLADIYDATKWALNGFTQAWAEQLRPHGVRVNNLCMGAVDTPMLRGLFGISMEDEPPEDVYPQCLALDDVSRILIELLEEGPEGRSSDNVGIWVGHPVVLRPASAVLNVPAGSAETQSLAWMDLLPSSEK